MEAADGQVQLVTGHRMLQPETPALKTCRIPVVYGTPEAAEEVLRHAFLFCLLVFGC